MASKMHVAIVDMGSRQLIPACATRSGLRKQCCAKSAIQALETPHLNSDNEAHLDGDREQVAPPPFTTRKANTVAVGSYKIDGGVLVLPSFGRRYSTSTWVLQIAHKSVPDRVEMTRLGNVTRDIFSRRIVATQKFVVKV